MSLPNNSVSNNLENTLRSLLKTYQLEEIFFVLYCYVHERAQMTQSENECLEKKQWEKLTNILDMACSLIEEANENADKDSHYLIY